jgi:RNA polymerase sigma-70 factor (ECF subfamily)
MERFLVSVERRAFRMAQIATGSTEDALDIVQDAMLRLVRRYRSKPETEWKPLFYRILQNRIKDHHRRHRLRDRWHVLLTGRSSGDGEDAEDPMAAVADYKSPNPGDQLASEDTVVALGVVLRALPTRQQQAFLLRVWEGMSVRETAAAMRCSEGSVKTHYSRAVHSLRDIMEDHFP